MRHAIGLRGLRVRDTPEVGLSKVVHRFFVRRNNDNQLIQMGLSADKGLLSNQI
ncbi:MAG TPA: hypothetical protein VGE64_03595 [Xanthomonadaceae bacterium]